MQLLIFIQISIKYVVMCKTSKSAIMVIKDFIAIVDKSTSMNEDDIIYVVNNISSILYEPIEISNTDKKYWR